MSARSRYKKQPRAVRRQQEAQVLEACDRAMASLREEERLMEQFVYDAAGRRAVQEWRERVQEASA